MLDYEFKKCVDHYKGDYLIRTLTCREHFLVMSFAQLTGREGLRDIETCLTTLAGKLYHSGISKPVSRSTLADANDKTAYRRALPGIDRVTELFPEEELNFLDLLHN